MINRLLALAKPFALGLFAVAFFALGQGQARADEVTITGSTTGTVIGVPQLTFTGNNFTGTTALGVGALSDENRLGTFTLNTDATQPVAGSFTLNVTFSAPAGITGGQGAMYTATITGSVSPNVNQGGATIHFDNPTQVFTFNDGTTAGTFTLTVNDVFVQSGRDAALQGGFTGQQSAVPEPMTMLLFGSGLAGIAARARRRKKGEQN
ncbi:MAG TPA: PEP-CTERM sorting domain-containing protein [Pyrinomonadaceae bacterium]|jgi:hypothetical protein